MKIYNFTIVASGPTPDDPDFDERFFNAGCDDAVLSFQKGVIVLDFAREAKSLTHALISAIRDVTNAGAKVRHIEPDCLVSVSDIAARTTLTKAAISLYTRGKRAKDFPHPVARLTTETPMWDWLEVARWMYRYERVGLWTVVEARTVKALNDLTSRDVEPVEINVGAILQAARTHKRGFADA